MLKKLKPLEEKMGRESGGLKGQPTNLTHLCVLGSWGVPLHEYKYCINAFVAPEEAAHNLENCHQ